MIDDRSNDVMECQNSVRVLVYLYVCEGMPGIMLVGLVVSPNLSPRHWEVVSSGTPASQCCCLSGAR